MPQANPLKQIVVKQKEGRLVGIYSCCSASNHVTGAALEYIKHDDSCVLIETAANQVDQGGGYTGTTPKDFRKFILKKAKAIGVDEDRIFLGRGRLGPLTFAALPEKETMEKAEELARCYVVAGFTKIYIDASMKVADDDPSIRLSDVVAAERGVYLARICKETYQELLKQNPNAVCPICITGSKVPIPGGAQEEGAGTQVTRAEDFKATVKTFEGAFVVGGLKETWKDVMGVVARPGVEEKDDEYTEYNRSKVRGLMASIKEYPNLIFEGRPTNYQTKLKLHELIKDGVGILKVGPGLIYTMREVLFTFTNVETAVYRGKEEALSNFIDALEEAMVEEPKNWKKHYREDGSTLWFKRRYSFFDRSRYYMPNPNIVVAKGKLIANLCKSGIPLSTLSQFVPIQYTKVHEGHLENNPEALIRDHVINTTNEYLYTAYQETLF